MKLYEFLQKIEDTGCDYTINLRNANKNGFLSKLEFTIYIGNYYFTWEYVERANNERGEVELPEDFTESWDKVQTFIKKSLAKIAIDEE